MAESVHKEQNKDITVPVEVLVKDGRSTSSSISSTKFASASSLIRKCGHKLDKNSFSFETGVPTVLSTEDFYNDDEKAI